MTDQENISLIVSKDEALVMFEFLSRFNETDHPDVFEDQAEQKTLWILECQLQEQLAEPFRADYLSIIQEARDRVRDDEFEFECDKIQLAKAKEEQK